MVPRPGGLLGLSLCTTLVFADFPTCPTAWLISPEGGGGVEKPGSGLLGTAGEGSLLASHAILSLTHCAQHSQAEVILTRPPLPTSPVS